MKTYARLQDNSIAELLATEGDLVGRFNPALVWIDVTGIPGLAEGWLHDGTGFHPPPPLPPAVVPSLAELQALLAAIAAQIAALTPHG